MVLQRIILSVFGEKFNQGELTSLINIQPTTINSKDDPINDHGKYNL